MEFLNFRDAVSTWTHLLWAILTLPATALLWHRCRGDRAKQLAMLIFGASSFLCFASSALYHGVRLPADRVEFLARLDYIGIFLLIAGTGTPIVFTLLRGQLRWGTLGGVWLMAAVGIVCRACDLDVSRWASTTLYLGMGWGLASCYPEMARVLSRRHLNWIVLGGVFYSIGALVYLFHWPALWPGVFGPHEVLHVCDMAGSLAHYWFILKYVAPFERQRADGVELKLADRSMTG